MNSGFQDPYLIPGTNVLINKLKLTDNYELSIQEERLSKRRANELAAQGITGEFDLDHFKSIHQYVFQDVYDWAGETRVVNISKGGTVFESASRIGAATYGIHRVLEQENFLVDLERAERETALRIYPDLEGAFKALDTVQKTLQDKGMTSEKQDIFMKTFKNQIGAKLDAGVRHFDNAAVSQASIVALQSPTMKIKR